MNTMQVGLHPHYLHMERCRWRVAIVLALMVTVSLGCTIKVPVNPDVGKIDIAEQLPIEAGLLITEETRNYVFRGYPESFTAGGRSHEFFLGEALEKASVQTFSQVFQKVLVVRTSEEASVYRMVIEPKIEDFHFRYDQLSYAGFAVAVLSKITVHVTLTSGETRIWEKSLESPEQKRGPWVLNFSVEKEAGESAAEALAYALRTIAVELATDTTIRQFISGQV